MVNAMVFRRDDDSVNEGEGVADVAPAQTHGRRAPFIRARSHLAIATCLGTYSPWKARHPTGSSRLHRSFSCDVGLRISRGRTNYGEAMLAVIESRGADDGINHGAGST